MQGEKLMRLGLGMAVVVVAFAVLLPVFGANPPEIREFSTTSVTRSSVRVTWRTDVAATGELEWGLQPSVLNNRVADDRRVANHALYISALAPGTTYYVRACSADTERRCTEPRQFRTAPAITGVAETAELPRQEVHLDFSEADGKKFTVAPDCSDLQKLINEAAAAASNQTHEVLLRPGMLCSGGFVLPERPANATGWVVIRTVDSELPPPGSRMDGTFFAATATLAGNKVQARMLPFMPKDGCILGDFWWDDDEREFSLYRCTDPRAVVWTKEELLGSGTHVPDTCESGDWFYRTDIREHNRRAYWCVAKNNWRNVEFIGGGFYNSWAVVTAAAKANRYRLTGLTIQSLPTPEKYASIFGQETNTRRTPLGSLYGCLVSTRPDNSSIFFDRIIFDGIGYPTRTLNAFCEFNGSNMAIAGSYFNEMNTWVHPSTSEISGSAIQFSEGPGPIRIEGNYFKNNLGITIFHNDDSGTRTTRSANDVIVRNNIFFEDPSYNAADPNSNGRYYYRRNIVELKRGDRWLIEGNQFLGGWTTVVGGSCLAFTPRPGSTDDLSSKLSIRDITIRNNAFRHCPETIAVVGFNDGPDMTLEQASRMLIENNLVMYSGITSTGINVGWPARREFNGQFIITQLGFQDLIIRANTIFENIATGHGANLMTHLQDPANTGLEVRDNIYTVTGPAGARAGIWGNNKEGIEALNDRWRQGAQPAWQMRSNLIVRAAGNSNNYPSTTYFGRSVSEVGFADDLSLVASSRFKGGGPQAASSGEDLGVNITRLKQGLRFVEEAALEAVQSTSVILRYSYWTPQVEDAYCAIDVSEARVFLSPMRTWDSGRGKGRSVTIEGLKPGQQYFMRLLCPGQSMLASFTTAQGANGEAVNQNSRPSRSTVGSPTQVFRVLWSTEKTLYVLPKSKKSR